MTLSAPALLLGKAYILVGLTFCPPPEKKPEIEVTFKHQKPTYDYSVPIKELTRRLKIAKGEQSTDLQTHHVVSHTMGMTETSVVRQYKYSFRYLSDGTGKTCLYLQSGVLAITHKTEVYIGKELKDYPCRKEKTLAHENKHVSIGKEAIEDSIDDIRRELKSSAGRKVPKIPLRESDVAGRMKKIQEKILDDVRHVIKKMEKKLADRQAVIDTPENYKYESGLCPHERVKVE